MWIGWARAVLCSCGAALRFLRPSGLRKALKPRALAAGRSCFRVQPPRGPTDTMLFLANQTLSISSFTVDSVTNATPIVVNCSTAGHGLQDGSLVYIFGETEMTSINGIWPVTISSARNFSLNGSSGNAAYAGASFAHVGCQSPPLLVDSTQLAEFNDGDFTLTFVLSSATASPLGSPYPTGTFRKQITPPSIRAWFSDSGDAGMMSSAPLGGPFSALGPVPSADSRTFTVRRANAPDARIGTDLVQYVALALFCDPGSNADIIATSEDDGVTPTIGQGNSVQTGNSFVFYATIG